MPMSETDGRTYSTENACWSALTKKMALLDQLGDEPDFQSLTAGCFKDE